MVRKTCLHIFVKLLVVLLVFCVVTNYFVNYKVQDRYFETENLKFDGQNCNRIHIGMIVANSSSSAILNFYTVFKSLLFFRTNPLHIHILVDHKTEYILKTLFETWSISQLNISYYKKLHFTSENHMSITQFLISKIINNGIEKFLLIDSNVVIMDNIYKLWTLFDKVDVKFIGSLNAKNDLQYVVLIKAKNFLLNSTLSFETNPIIMHYILFCNTLEGRQICYDKKNNLVLKWNAEHVQNDRFSFFLKYNGTLLKSLIGNCTKHLEYIKSRNEIVEFLNSKRTINLNCSEFIDNALQTWRTLLFFKDAQLTITSNDVTFVSQLSYDRIGILNQLFKLWNGPIALGLFASDSEIESILQFLKSNRDLKNRSNIVIHIIFKENGKRYPINVLRNVALKNVVTPYVFLVDVDFIPNLNLYHNLKYYLNITQNMTKKAFVVPAFESTTDEIPETKCELLELLNNNTILPFHYKKFRKAHAPTNYQKWKLAEDPYPVKWKFEYEPYLVVQSNVSLYDTRFFGYGWNKVSHVMELYKQNFEFLVLPKAFIVHKCHKWSNEKHALLMSRKYQKCLHSIKRSFIKDINQKYS